MAPTQTYKPVPTRYQMGWTQCAAHQQVSNCSDHVEYVSNLSVEDDQYPLVKMFFRTREEHCGRRDTSSVFLLQVSSPLDSGSCLYRRLWVRVNVVSCFACEALLECSCLTVSAAQFSLTQLEVCCFLPSFISVLPKTSPPLMTI